MIFYDIWDDKYDDAFDLFDDIFSSNIVFEKYGTHIFVYIPLV